mmetsp:Transcript_17213/g.41311  ORF Transcript_17213/g.41311 Transcript_17213/m.41311 type:complete len:310 (-) Transcript_17213:464-1393(-)
MPPRRPPPRRDHTRTSRHGRVGTTRASGTRPRDRSRSRPRPVPMRTRRGEHGQGGLRARSRLRDEQSGEARRDECGDGVQGPPHTRLRRPFLLPGAKIPELSRATTDDRGGGGADADPTFHRSRPRGRDACASPLSDTRSPKGGDDEPVRVRESASLDGTREATGDALFGLEVGRRPTLHEGEETALSGILSRRCHEGVSQPRHGRFDSQLPVGLLSGNSEAEGVLRARAQTDNHDAGSHKEGGVALRYGDLEGRLAGADGGKGHGMEVQNPGGGVRGGRSQHDGGWIVAVLGCGVQDRGSASVRRVHK